MRKRNIIISQHKNGILRNIIYKENEVHDSVLCCLGDLIYQYFEALECDNKCKAEEIFKKISCILPIFLINHNDQSTMNALRAKAEKLCNCKC